MIGTIINVIAVLVGGTLGTVFGNRLPQRNQETVIKGLGLFTFAIGIQMFLNTENVIIALGSLLLGAMVGEWWRIETGLEKIGQWLQDRFMPKEGDDKFFIQGFLTASLVFCVGPMTILGAIQDGLSGDYSLLALKSVLDGFAAMAFASSLGVGVIFSALVVLIYQGGLSLLAVQIQDFVTPAMMDEMTAVGGVIMLGLSISSLLEIKKIRTANFLPALFIAPLLVFLLSIFGWL
ncbi:MAG: DUF554 domain-containing protein [Anaerolineaceae bacterium]|nr:DUF554 domain-containing protein [Anaerolineaceae bacterium]